MFLAAWCVRNASPPEQRNVAIEETQRQNLKSRAAFELYNCLGNVCPICSPSGASLAVPLHKGIATKFSLEGASLKPTKLNNGRKPEVASCPSFEVGSPNGASLASLLFKSIATCSPGGEHRGPLPVRASLEASPLGAVHSHGPIHATGNQ